jgi:DNA primase
MAMFEVPFPQALRFLKNLKDGDLKNLPKVSYDIDNRKQICQANFKIDKEKLNILMPDKYFSETRGIPSNIIQKHKVGYWQKTGTFMDRRAIVPIFDIDNELVGFSGRITVDNQDQSKWVHGKDFVTRKAGVFNKAGVLYNLNNCKNSVSQTKKIFIVEGPIDVWKLEIAGIYNVVATLGLGISFEQQRLLVSLGVETIVICYDNDRETHAGQRAAERIKEQLSGMFKIEIKLPKDSKDYGDMSTHDILENLLNE